MIGVIKEMRELAQELLASGEVSGVYGWTKGSRPELTPPVLIRDAADVGRFHYDEYAVHNLTGFLLDDRLNGAKRALFVKGCDSRGIVRLLQDQQITRDQVIVIGVPCPGMRDSSGTLFRKCAECRYPNPVLADRTVGAVTVTKEPGLPTGVTSEVARQSGVGSQAAERYAAVAAIEALSPDEKYAYWEKQHEKCIRCYACRNVCPACNCRECIFDSEKKGWVSKAATKSDNAFFAITRAMHVAGRCVDCGECERICPMAIPIMAINRKIEQDLHTLFTVADAGVDLDVPAPLGQFKMDDPEEFL